MAHETHLMERGLPIEDDVVAIAKMPLNDVTKVQVRIRAILLVIKIALLVIVAPDDVFGARPLVGTVLN